MLALAGILDIERRILGEVFQDLHDMRVYVLSPFSLIIEPLRTATGQQTQYFGPCPNRALHHVRYMQYVNTNRESTGHTGGNQQPDCHSGILSLSFGSRPGRQSKSHLLLQMRRRIQAGRLEIYLVSLAYLKDRRSPVAPSTQPMAGHKQCLCGGCTKRGHD